MTTLRASFWAWVPAGLLAAMLLGLLSMALIASRDPGFALERDYYKKGVAFDREIAQREENARLNWDVEAVSGPMTLDGRALLVVRLRSADAPVAGASAKLEALRNASAARVVEAPMREAAPGEYHAHLPLNRGGLWEFRLRFEREKEQFTHVVRLDVAEASR